MYPREYDIVFVCRSGAWTPPWTDDKWITFVRELKMINPLVWRNKTVLRDSLTPREFDKEKTLELTKDLEAARKQLLGHLDIHYLSNEKEKK